MTASSIAQRLGPWPPTAGRVAAIAGLTAAWCTLWREASPANIVVGFALALAITASGLATDGRNGVRLRPLLQLLWLVLVDLVRSTWTVAFEVLTPTDHTNEAIIAVELDPRSKRHFLLLTVAITLTPGTAVVDADPENGTLYLHLLHFVRVDETVSHVQKMADLSCRALPAATLEDQT